MIHLLAFRIGLSIVFIILGFAGILLPILPGWLFFLMAFAVLSPQHEWTKKVVIRLERHVPKMAGYLRRLGIG